MADETSFGGEDTPWFAPARPRRHIRVTEVYPGQTTASALLPRPDHGVTFALLKFAPARPRRHIRVTEVCPGQTTASHSRY
ncbi:hypothetical protein RRG08_046799 [Elysia crispata]|uniref:Uncharacterized protein n=1 Tax=Elysia crispata TaxID=231223 RepID=A0AAE0Z7L0_9GAST|nr:hypothetical protein RRG08_046799 [Elysia crispata]